MVGDLVSIRSPKLGTLTNQVNHCDKIPPWTFGISALMRNLAAAGAEVTPLVSSGARSAQWRGLLR